MLFRREPRQPAVTRTIAFQGRPVRTPVLRAEAAGAGLRLTVQCRRPRWQALLGAQTLCEHTFELDALGREVYGACDGNASVAAIVRDFAARHRVSEGEAEMAVAQYLRTLMTRGLIVMRMAT